jgi:probable rRNA maturation factor
MSTSKRLNLSVQYATRKPWVPERAEVRRWARAALSGGAQITVRFVDPEEGCQLNRDYRGKDYATNVLSFPYEQQPLVCGDLVITPEVCCSEAATQGKKASDHTAHLVVHGVLHLQGYDHESEADAEAMEAREREILARLGIADPYFSAPDVR